ncbi:MAG: DUF1549 domain-containing protein [Planctomycetes bacterium]|nr:DUF1549 domain-containing protein [Planctomycetota bacterium]
MFKKYQIILASLAFLALASRPVPAQEKFLQLIVEPNAVQLRGPQAVYSLLVTGKTSDGRLVDLTHDAKYDSSQAKVAKVTQTGVIRGLADGKAEITVEARGRTATVRVDVQGSQDQRAYHFENDIIPLLNRFGCNSSGCHGFSQGQNGFKLAVFGSDPDYDFNSLVKEGRGRRIFPAAPDASLVLTKASGQLPHGGGIRIHVGTDEYNLIRGWIAAGAPRGDPKAPGVVKIRVEPKERLLRMKGAQQLRVIATYSNGRDVDVTAHARYQANNDGLASVSADGLVSVLDTPGEVAVMASYANCVDTFRAIVPRAEVIASYPAFPERNFIDGHVLRRLKKLNIAPSELCDDSTYLRRVHLDLIGTLPTADEARRFLNDKRANRRELLVDDLLDRPEYADYWALKWSDLLRVDRQALGHKKAHAFYRWIRDSLAKNKPFDVFARELLTAEGPIEEVGAANFYKVMKKPGETASTISQVLLGVRIACAECHHHPFDRWSQADYFGMTAFFTPLGLRPSARGEAVIAQGDPITKHPRTGETVHAHALGDTTSPERKLGDRRLILADWMTSPKNPYFARNLANRTWAHFLGRGLVEPIDDVRDTNPPSNPELLDALSKHLIDAKFDVKQLIRAITRSRTYQLSSKPNATNEKDEQNYSRALFRRIDAEVLLDMVSQTLGVPERFDGAAPGTRAIQLWDSKVNHYFLKLYGRPQRVTACECERITEPSVSQVLHLLNAPEIHAKLTHERGNIARWVRQKKSDADLVDEIYLTFYGRMPGEAERKASQAFLQANQGQRRQAAEDLAWTLMNTLEFSFKR